MEFTEYITYHKTTADYNAKKDNFNLPHVAYIEDADILDYKPYDPYGGYDYVEIGGLKWATKNIGATSITDYGLYFQWADTQGYTADQLGSGEGQKYFGWADYKYGNGTNLSDTTASSYMSKYNSTDGLTELQLSDDAARVNMGSAWRIPTTEEFQTLVTSTTSAWTESYEGSNVSGVILTSTDGSNKKLFFPASGLHNKGVFYKYEGSACCYWSNSLLNSDLSIAYNLASESGYVTWQDSSRRRIGMPIRGVAD